jgi:hypothetical protein
MIRILIWLIMGNAIAIYPLIVLRHNKLRVTWRDCIFLFAGVTWGLLYPPLH